jgi:hypothetical protein
METEKLQMTIQYGIYALHSGYIRLNTHTHAASIFIALTRQKYSRKRASLLRYTYNVRVFHVLISNAFPVCNFYSVIAVSKLFHLRLNSCGVLHCAFMCLIRFL